MRMADKIKAGCYDNQDGEQQFKKDLFAKYKLSKNPYVNCLYEVACALAGQPYANRAYEFASLVHLMRLMTDLAYGITPRKVSRYLRAKGWALNKDFPREDVWVFSGPTDDNMDPIELIVPRSVKSHQWRTRVMLILVALETITGQSQESVAHDIRSS